MSMNLFKVSKFFLFLVPLTVVIVTPSTLFPFIVGKYVFFRTAVSLALIFFLLGYAKTRINADSNADKRGFNISDNLRRNLRLSALWRQPLVIAVSVFVVIFLLACFFGVDPKMSFWSNFERGEGGLQILYFGIFFGLLAILFREEKDWKKIFWISILAAVLVIFYGLGAHLKYIDAEMTTRFENGFEIRELTGRGGPWFQTFKNYIGGSFKEPHFRFAGSLGNPAYTATYLVFALFYAAYLLITRINTDKKLIYTEFLVGLLILFFVFFWLAATRGGFIGLLVGVVAAAGYFAYRHKSWRKWFLAGIVIMLLVISLLVYFKEASFVKSLPGSRLFDISFSAETFQHRTIMWKIALDGWKERPLLGWGPENYLKIFDKHFNIEYFIPAAGFGAWFDRAHSVYFDYLAETGILGLLSYLSIFIVFYWQLLSKTRINAEINISHQSSVSNALLIALPIAYLIQGLVLFETLPLYLNLFLFLAFANYKFNGRSLKV